MDFGLKLLRRNAKSTEFRPRNAEFPGVLPQSRHKSQAAMTYTRGDADFDILDTMLLSNATGSLNVHRFSQPPKSVLDIGCGSGYWIIQAAKQWPQSQFVGTDITHIQPDLTRLEAYRDLADRVKWVHQNFLDTLPFDASFDFVRMSGLGMAIPEDEWPGLLTDIFRVMRPGGILEIIVDDPVFPCPSGITRPVTGPLLLKERRSGLLRGLLRSRKNSSQNLKDTLADVQPEVPQELREAPLREKEPPIKHPQDHSRLKAAWNSMLSQGKFPSHFGIAIPSYLSSTPFQIIQICPPTTVTLPPNSGAVSNQSLRLTRSTGNLPASSSYKIPKSNMLTVPQFDRHTSPSTSSVAASQLPRSNEAALQLARTVRLITASKALLLQHYEVLFRREVENIIRSVSPGDEALLCMKKSALVGHAFEIDWKNWCFDMSDRMGRSAQMKAKLGWAAAFDVNEEVAAWRGKLSNSDEGKHQVAAYNPNDLCRSLCTFVCRKP